jgi:VanZ family protein
LEEPAVTRSFLRLWLPPVLYVLLIFTVSSIPSLHPPSKLGFVWADKVAHFGEYAVLGFLLQRALGRRAGRSGLLLLLLSLFLSYSIGGLDEIYQGTVPGREMSLADWSADVLGATMGILSRRFLFERGGAEAEREGRGVS